MHVHTHTHTHKDKHLITSLYITQSKSVAFAFKTVCIYYFCASLTLRTILSPTCTSSVSSLAFVITTKSSLSFQSPQSSLLRSSSVPCTSSNAHSFASAWLRAHAASSLSSYSFSFSSPEALMYSSRVYERTIFSISCLRNSSFPEPLVIADAAAAAAAAVGPRSPVMSWRLLPCARLSTSPLWQYHVPGHFLHSAALRSQDPRSIAAQSSLFSTATGTPRQTSPVVPPPHTPNATSTAPYGPMLLLLLPPPPPVPAPCPPLLVLFLVVIVVVVVVCCCCSGSPSYLEALSICSWIILRSIGGWLCRSLGSSTTSTM